MFPTNGSARGGTQISITLNVPIDVYSDNIKVLVGGKMSSQMTISQEIGGYYTLFLEGIASLGAIYSLVKYSYEVDTTSRRTSWLFGA